MHLLILKYHSGIEMFQKIKEDFDNILVILVVFGFVKCNIVKFLNLYIIIHLTLYIIIHLTLKKSYTAIDLKIFDGRKIIKYYI